MADSEQAWHSVQPTGLAKGLLATTIMFTITTAVMIVLRGYIRTVNRLNGPEDYLMYIGGVSFRPDSCCWTFYSKGILIYVLMYRYSI